MNLSICKVGDILHLLGVQGRSVEKSKVVKCSIADV
jgi:hypothetical protein